MFKFSSFAATTFAAAVLLNSAQAEPVIVAEERVLGWRTSEINRREFQYNPSLGRAWIQIMLSKYSDEGPSQWFRFLVPDLRFDGETGEVVYEAGGKRVVCAYEKRTWHSKILRETGACSIKAWVERREVDNGFEIVHHKYLVVTLEASEKRKSPPRKGN